MNILYDIQSLKAAIMLCNGNIKQCERALICPIHEQPFIHSIEWTKIRNGETGRVTLDNGIAFQAITLQMKQYKEKLQMLEKELQDLQSASQF
jgi:hypothetical protein